MWLKQALPAAEYEQSKDSPTALLMELYFPVFAFGPNALIWQARLELLYNQLIKTRNNARVHERFVGEFIKSYARGQQTFLLSASHQSCIDDAITQQRGNNLLMEDPDIALVLKPLLDYAHQHINGVQAKIDFWSAAKQFSMLTLGGDLLEKHYGHRYALTPLKRDWQKLSNAHERFMKRWQLVD
jgi:hypothetical protein